MNLPRLGHAVIINNIAGEMPGSNEDVKALREAYQTVGFEVQVHENCSSQVSSIFRFNWTVLNILPLFRIRSLSHLAFHVLVEN